MVIAGNFFKTSYHQFINDCDTYNILTKKTDEEEIKKLHSDIIRPKRRSETSPKYIFYLPFPLCLEENRTIIIPTGIGIDLLPGWILLLQSAIGEKAVFTVETDGVYSRGITSSTTHVLVKITSKENISLQAGDPYMTGTFLQYGVALSEKEF